MPVRGARIARREERGEYYRILEHTQRGTMDVMVWMEWRRARTALRCGIYISS
jgi:hypothetical protein